MGQNETEYQLKVDGMTCNGCEVRIEKKLKQTKGVMSVNANYPNSLVKVSFDKSQTNLSEIQSVITKLGYTIGAKTEKFKIIDLLLIVVCVYLVSIALKRFGVFQVFDNFPQATQDAGYIALFFIGVLTSVHCIAMCGGISLTQCVSSKIDETVSKTAALKPSFLYNTGRVISYTLIGAVVGALGSVISFSPFMKGMVAFIAGVFMVIMGLNMLNIFPWLKQFSLRMPKMFINKLDNGKSNSSFYIGLLNGFMPCGPLQAMQLFALSTGSPVQGALSMFFFSIGTFPLMFLLGALGSLLTKKFTAKMMSVSAVLIVFMGIFMFNNGMGLAGIALPTFSMMSSSNSSSGSNVVAVVDVGTKFQTVSFDLSARSYEPITVKAGIPVKWVINADESQITGCNNEVVVQEYNISKKLVPGENIIEFTPEKVGTIPYSCWMGMIRSSITVE